MKDPLVAGQTPAAIRGGNPGISRHGHCHAFTRSALPRQLPGAATDPLRSALTSPALQMALRMRFP